MKHEEIREAVRLHFMRGIETARARRAANGPLAEAKVAEFSADADRYDEALRTGQHWDPIAHDRELCDFISRNHLPIVPGTSDYEVLRVEHLRGWRDVARAVVSESKALETFDFNAPKDSAVRPRSTDRLLEPLWKEFKDYGKTEGRWTDKTIGEKEEHIALLLEILGSSTAARSVTRDDALRVRQALSRYPVNRRKLPSTRDKTLAELLAMPGLRTLNWRTTNKYMHTYMGLFAWAEDNGRVEKSPFQKLALKPPKDKGEARRAPFTVEQLRKIKRALAGNPALEPHRRWVTLLAMHSGARLNEVAQLDLTDIVQVDSIWCIDINVRQGPSGKKRLKNNSSARVVPIHPDVIEAGFLKYVSHVTPNPTGRLFPELRYDASEGYGRNVNRWFNDFFLPRLELKTRQLTFHSLRHSVANLLRAAEVPEAHISAVLGHEQEAATTAGYGGGFPAWQLDADLRKIGI
ncbi:MAG: site-specific integrase [Devosia sp.]|nr:site-specific integrase [Devosia sp.]